MGVASMKFNQNVLRREFDRCREEIASCERLLRSGHPDVEGLCLALSDWLEELSILREEYLA